MLRSDVRMFRFRAIGPRVAIAALAGWALLLTGPATSPQTERIAAAVSVTPTGYGLAWPGYTVRDPAEQRRELSLLLAREKARAAAGVAPVVASRTTAPASTPVAPGTAPTPAATAGGDGQLVVSEAAVAVALRFALDQVGKPYVWGATGPDTYDCSGLTQRSYAAAGVAIPRTSREQVRIGAPVGLADLLPGDLLFWAYDPGDLTTVHHVALYLGDGKVVQAPQPGETVEVAGMWLDGYAGAVRIVGGPAVPVPAGLTPSSGPQGDSGMAPPGTVDPTTGAPTTGASSTGAPTTGNPSTGAPTTVPGTTVPGTTAPGSTAPGTTAPGSTVPARPTTPGAASPTGSAAPSRTAAPTGSATTPASTTPAPTVPAPSSTAPSPPPPGTTPPPQPSATTPAPTPTGTGSTTPTADATSASPAASPTGQSPTATP